MKLIADVFLEILARKNMVRSISKKPFFRGHLNRPHGKGSTHCCNLNASTFTIFLNHSKDISIGKSLF